MAIFLMPGIFRLSPLKARIPPGLIEADYIQASCRKLAPCQPANTPLSRGLMPGRCLSSGGNGDGRHPRARRDGDPLVPDQRGGARIRPVTPAATAPRAPR